MVITQNNFNSEVENSDKPVLIDFWASWCGPCMMMSPVVEQIEKEHPEIKVGKVNVDDEMVLAQKFMTVSAVWTIADIFNGLMAIPNLIALIALNGVVVSETNKYINSLKK